MLSASIYFAIYLFEVLSCALCYENLYLRKRGKAAVLAAYAASLAVQYSLSFLQQPVLNTVAFFVCNYLLVYFCYEAKLKMCLFSTAMLTFLMFITELIIYFVSTYIFKITLMAYQGDLLTLVVQSSLSKLLFFMFIYLFAKYYKNRREQELTNKYTALLSVLPLTSMMCFMIMHYCGVVLSNESEYYGYIVICAILLLFANLLIFYIWDKVQKNNSEITALQLEKQKGEMSTEYYELLSAEYSGQRILIHDIKNHFQILADLAAAGEREALLDYIAELTQSIGINVSVQYSGNKMVDVILNRYCHTCETLGIKSEIEACASDLSFMSDTDVVAMLDNLLDNALEAASESTEKEICFSIYIRNERFAVISVSNSCEKKPRSKGAMLFTGKKNASAHGIGTQSIKRIASIYGGEFDWHFSPERKRFEATVAIPLPNQI